MEFDEIVVKESPGLCRCCLSEGCYKDMGTEYAWMNETEVYADMLLECFDISISQLNDGPNGPNRLICEVCITRLRDACYFKKQVLDSEKKFVDMVGRGDFRPKAVLLYQSNMKAESGEEMQVSLAMDDGEVEYLEDEMDYVDDTLKPEAQQDPEPTVSDVTADPLPMRSKRGRPRKTPAKPEKKKVKVETKAKSSKALVKDSDTSDRHTDKQIKDDLLQILSVIIKNSTIMPFRWQSNKFMCFYCCCPFEDSCHLKRHTKSEHDEVKLKNVQTFVKTTRIKFDVSDISCKLCPKLIESLDEFLTHAVSVHDLKFNKELSKDFFAYKLSDDDMNCLDCGQSFKFFGPLLKHMHKYHNKSNAFLCEICGQGFVAKSNVSSHIKNVHVQSKCGKCHKVFQSQYALTVHYDKVHRVGKLKCPKCPEVLSSRYFKKQHLALVHNVQTSVYKCDVCSKVFTIKSRLVEHKARIHLKEKSLACEICGFKVFCKDLLKKHMVRHDDSRPFQCDICKKSFQRKKTLEFHRRIHTNDKRYACKECGKAFVQTTSLKLHVKVHHSNDNTAAWK